MIRTLLYHANRGTVQTGGHQLLEAWKNDPDVSIWADFSGDPADGERAIFERLFGIHPLAIDDALRSRHPPKLERFPDYTFILLRGLDAEKPALNSGTIQLAMFVGSRFLVTRHSGPSPSIEAIWAQESKDPNRLRAGPDAISLAISRRVVDRYLEILMHVEARLDAVEDEIFRSPDNRLLEELIGYRTGLEKLRRVFVYHVQIFRDLRDEPPQLFEPQLIHAINDVYEHLERERSLADLYYGMAADLIEGYISVASHRLNEIMKVLTIVTVIFVPLSFLAGIYGMNFANMPELQARFGYFIVLAIMLCIVGGLLIFFRRKRWL